MQMTYTLNQVLGYIVAFGTHGATGWGWGYAAWAWVWSEDKGLHHLHHITAISCPLFFPNS